MELTIFGHAGTPVIVFPTSMGRFFDYENRGMPGVIAGRYDQGLLQAYCVDSVDKESWYNRAVSPAQKALRHLEYDRYLADEVIPFIRSRNQTPGLITTGCSFGGYHTINFALRHPDLVTAAISMGGAFSIKQFTTRGFDENCYLNSPPEFLPNLNDPWLLDRIRRQRIVLVTGETDICLKANVDLSAILNRKGLPHWLDVWGNGTGHDWPWWEQMTVKHLIP